MTFTGRTATDDRPRKSKEGAEEKLKNHIKHFLRSTIRTKK